MAWSVGTMGSTALSWTAMLWSRATEPDGAKEIDQTVQKIFEDNLDLYGNNSGEKTAQESSNNLSAMKNGKSNIFSPYNIPNLQNTEQDKTRRKSYVCQGYDNHGFANTEPNTLRKKSLNFINNIKEEGEVSKNNEVNSWINKMEQKTTRRISAGKPPATIMEDGYQVKKSFESFSTENPNQPKRRKSSCMYSFFPNKQDLVSGSRGQHCNGCQGSTGTGVLEKRISFGNLVACLTVQQTQQCVRNQRNTRPRQLPHASLTPVLNKTHNPSVLWGGVLSVLSYFARLLDLCFDIVTAFIYYDNGYLEYAILSSVIIILAYLLQCAVAYQIVLDGKFGILSSRKIALLVFFFLPFIIIAFGVHDNINGRRGHIVESLYVVMLYQIIFQSFPQTCLEIYTICVCYSLGRYVSVLEWLSCASSALSLTIGLSYTVIFVHENWKIKLLFTCFGGFSAMSRLLVCTTYGLYHPTMWLLPFLLGLTAAFVTWIFYKTCVCWKKHHVMSRYSCNSLPQSAATMLSWPMTYLFNCFTVSGVPVSLIMLILAGVNYTLEVHTGISWLSLGLTSVVFLINVILTTIPRLQVLAKKFYEGEEVDDEPYHFTCLGRRSSIVE